MVELISQVSDPRFESTTQILDYAYWCEAQTRAPSLSFADNLTVSAPDEFSHIIEGMDRQEIITEGLMLKNTAIRAVDDKGLSHHRWTVGITYRKRPTHDKVICRIKDSELHLLARHIVRLYPNIPDVWYVVYILKLTVKDLSGMPKKQTDGWWVDHLRRSDRTLRRYKAIIQKIYSEYYTFSHVVISQKYHSMGILNNY